MKNVPGQRPFWQSEPCPAWCGERHKNTDAACDRYHRPPGGGLGDVELTVDDGSLYVDLEQHVREIDARVMLIVERPKNFAFSFTPDEAERLARALLDAAGLAGEGR